jgi:hypothetical protein
VRVADTRPAATAPRSDRAMPIFKKAGDVPFEVASRLCVRGGHLKEWAVLPVTEVDGRDVITISARSSFLTNIAFGDTAEHRFELTRLCAELRDKLLQADGIGTGVVEGEEIKGKAKLDLGESDDDAAAGPPSKKRHKGMSGRWHDVVVRGVTVMARLRQGQQLLVSAESASIVALAAALTAPSQAELVEKKAAKEKEKARTEELHISDDKDRGRIRWRWPTTARMGGWVVIYQDEKGEKHQKHAGLDIPKTNFKGEVMQTADYMKVREEVLISARKQWNTLDQSSALRYA